MGIAIDHSLTAPIHRTADERCSLTIGPHLSRSASLSVRQRFPSPTTRYPPTNCNLPPATCNLLPASVLPIRFLSPRHRAHGALLIEQRRLKSRHHMTIPVARFADQRFINIAERHPRERPRLTGADVESLVVISHKEPLVMVNVRVSQADVQRNT